MTKQDIDYAVLSEPFPGETLSGDESIFLVSDRMIFLAAIDVAGHGPKANELAQDINGFLASQDKSSLITVIQDLHEHLKGTRGCVGSFCLLDLETLSLRYSGVGNFSALIVGETGKRFINREGIIGYVLPSIIENSYILSESDTLILYSDGIKDYFDLEGILDLNANDAQSIAAAIMQAFKKGTDDAMCLVLKFKNERNRQS